MTTPTTLKHGSATWWVLQTLRDFGAMSEKELRELGTHETPEALAHARKLHMVIKNHDGIFEIQPKGRNALAVANKQRWKDNKATPAATRAFVNASTVRKYDGAELRPFDGRPGAMDAYSLPSRMGDRRVHYRTGEAMV